MNNHIIQKSYYIKFALKIIAIVAASVILSSVFLYHLTWKILNAIDLGSMDMISRHIFFQSVAVFFLFSLFIFFGVVVLTVFNSHKVAGPLYRLKKAIRQVTSGQLDFRVAFRKNDVIHPMAESFNNMIDRYNEKLNFIENRLIALRTSSVSLLEEHSDEDQELIRMKQYLQEISETYKQIQI